VRETWEEAAARVEIISPYTHLDIPVIGQAYILFRARLAPPYTFCSGPESLEVELFDPADIPFDRLAFSSVAITLRQYLADRESGTWHVHHGVIVKAPGSAPNDPTSFSLQDHFAIPVGGKCSNGAGSHGAS
jgi:ADP-ribose/FAD diphosphatase